MEIRKEDILNVPTPLTAAGFVGVVYGVHGVGLDSWKGLVMTTAARFVDVADGSLARRLNQTSEFGALLDAAADKTGMAVIAAEQWRKGITPKALLASMAVQNTVSAVATYLAPNSPEGKRVSRDGKLQMALQNFSVGSHNAAYLLERNGNQKAARNLRIAGNIGGVIGTFYFGARASSHYIKRIYDEHAAK